MIYPQDENYKYGKCDVPFKDENHGGIDVKGKIVICHKEGGDKGSNVMKFGGRGMIVLSDIEATSRLRVPCAPCCRPKPHGSRNTHPALPQSKKPEPDTPWDDHIRRNRLRKQSST